MISAVPQGSILTETTLLVTCTWVHSQQVWGWHKAKCYVLHAGGRDLDRLKRLACVNVIQFNKAKCKVPHIGWGNLKQKYRLNDEQTESSLVEKDLKVLVDEKFSMRWQYSFTVLNSWLSTLVCIKRNLCRRTMVVILSLCSTLVRRHLQYCIQICGFLHNKDMNLLE